MRRMARIDRTEGRSPGTKGVCEGLRMGRWVGVGEKEREHHLVKHLCHLTGGWVAAERYLKDREEEERGEGGG